MIRKKLSHDQIMADELDSVSGPSYPPHNPKSSSWGGVNDEDPIINEEVSDATPLITTQAGSGQGLTGKLAFCIAACVVGTSFQFGYHIGVVNPPEEILESFINQTQYDRDGNGLSADGIRWLWSTIVAIFCVGGMVGGVTAGYFANHLGRKGAMLLNNALMIAAVLLMCLSKVALSYEMLIVGRFIVGVACGVSTGLAPLYLSEVAPVELRGAVGTVHQLSVTVAIVVGQVLGLTELLGTATMWPFLIGFSLIPAAIQLLTLPFCPDTPRYLMITKGDEARARQALIWLRGRANVQDDIMEIRVEIESSKNEPKVSVCDLFRFRHLRQPTIISIVLQFSQQFSGINAVIFYSTSLFESTGMSLANATYGTIGVAGVNVLMTFVSVILIERAGRRTLHLYGLGGMFIFSILITIAFIFKDQWHPLTYIAIVFTIGFVMFFAVGPGSIPWFIVAELFQQGPRATAMGVAVVANWFGSFTIALGFPWMEKGLGSYTFLPFAALLAIFWVFTYLKVPETRNKTIREISLSFQQEANYQTFTNQED